jgi:polyisoprenoid-binding protein YceI
MATTKWTLDPTHSELGFRIKHLMITHVSGQIKKFNVEAETQNNDFLSARIKMTAMMDSIDTNNEMRDHHLQNSDFFEVEKYPELQFQSTHIEKIDEENFHLHGDLTLKGITKPVKLQVEFSTMAKDPWGNERAGFMISGKINRSDWGVNFNSVLETGGVGLAEEVKIQSEIQLVKQVVEVAV